MAQHPHQSDIFLLGTRNYYLWLNSNAWLCGIFCIFPLGLVLQFTYARSVQDGLYLYLGMFPDGMIFDDLPTVKKLRFNFHSVFNHSCVLINIFNWTSFLLDSLVLLPTFPTNASRLIGLSKLCIFEWINVWKKEWMKSKLSGPMKFSYLFSSILFSNYNTKFCKVHYEVSKIYLRILEGS